MPTPFPLIAWGSADDPSLSPWVDGSGTACTVTTGVADPFGGTAAVTLNDDSAVNFESRRRATSIARNGVNDFAFFIKAGTATGCGIAIYDLTAGVNRALMTVTWSGGVPTVVATTGTLIGVIDVGSGWYLVLAQTNSLVVGANSNQIYLYPANMSGVANTGTTSFYLRNVVALDVLDRAVAWSDPRKGSSRSQSGAGVHTAWLKGRDYRLRADVLDIPASPRANPAIVSGWYGDNESTGINCGVDAMLHAARGTATLRWIRDRADCTTGNDATLLEPFEGGVELTDNGDRQIPGFLLHSLTPFLGY